MAEKELLTPEKEQINKRFEIKINNNKLRIEINNDEIIFTLIIGLSSYKYLKKLKYEEIIKELEILNYKDIKEVYDYLIKSEYEIIKEEKTIVINKNKKIKLEEKIIKSEEMIRILINEVNEIKKDNTNEKINELIKMNEEKEKKINILEKKYNELKEMIYEIDNNIRDKYRDKINLKYVTEKEGNYNIFGEEFVKNIIKIILN